MRVLMFMVLFGTFGFICSCSGSQQKNTEAGKRPVKTERAKEVVNVDVNKLFGSWEDTSLAKLNMMLFKDGSAKSDNSETLIYTKWKLDGNKLILTAKSIGNGISSISNEAYIIEQLNDKTMVLRYGDYVRKYLKKPGC